MFSVSGYSTPSLSYRFSPGRCGEMLTIHHDERAVALYWNTGLVLSVADLDST
jgi:hypothetical protein